MREGEIEVRMKYDDRSWLVKFNNDYIKCSAKK